MRAIDRNGVAVGFLLRAKGDRATARKFLTRAIALRGEPARIDIDRSGATAIAMNGN